MGLLALLWLLLWQYSLEAAMLSHVSHVFSLPDFCRQDLVQAFFSKVTV